MNRREKTTSEALWEQREYLGCFVTGQASSAQKLKELNFMYLASSLTPPSSQLANTTAAKYNVPLIAGSNFTLPFQVHSE